MTSMPWIKSYTKKLDDIRLVRSSDLAQLAYFKMELLAGKCDADGHFKMNGEQLTEEEIAFYIRMETKDLKKAIRELTANKLIHINGKGPQLTDFSSQQVSQQHRREAWRERQQRHRSVTGDSIGVTRDSTVTDAPVTILEEEKESKRRKEVLLLLSASAQKKLRDHPSWLTDAIELTMTKSTNDPAKYAAGIIRNWLTEGRKESKRGAGKSKRSKTKQPKLEGDDLANMREKAAKELLKK